MELLWTGRCVMVRAALLVAISAAAGCADSGAPAVPSASSRATAPPAVTLEPTKLQEDYAVASGPLAQAELQYNSVLNSLSSTDHAADAAVLDAADGTYAAALKQFDAALPTLPWPTSASADVHSLLAAHAALVADLEVPVTAQNLVTWIEKTLGDRTSAAQALQTLQSQPGVLAS